MLMSCCATDTNGCLDLRRRAAALDGRVSAEWSRYPGSTAQRPRDSVAPLQRSSTGWMPARTIPKRKVGVKMTIPREKWVWKWMNAGVLLDLSSDYRNSNVWSDTTRISHFSLEHSVFEAIAMERPPLAVTEKYKNLVNSKTWLKGFWKKKCVRKIFITAKMCLNLKKFQFIDPSTDPDAENGVNKFSRINLTCAIVFLIVCNFSHSLESFIWKRIGSRKHVISTQKLVKKAEYTLGTHMKIVDNNTLNFFVIWETWSVSEPSSVLFVCFTQK